MSSLISRTTKFTRRKSLDSSGNPVTPNLDNIDENVGSIEDFPTEENSPHMIKNSLPSNTNSIVESDQGHFSDQYSEKTSVLKFPKKSRTSLDHRPSTSDTHNNPDFSHPNPTTLPFLPIHGVPIDSTIPIFQAHPNSASRSDAQEYKSLSNKYLQSDHQASASMDSHDSEGSPRMPLVTAYLETQTLIDMGFDTETQKPFRYPLSNASSLSTLASAKFPNKYDQKALETIVTFNVGGKLFSTTLFTLKRSPCFLTNLADPDSPFRKVDYEHVGTKNVYFIDRDPKHFSTIINILRHPDTPMDWGVLPSSQDVQKELLYEANFYALNKTLIEKLKVELYKNLPARYSGPEILLDKYYTVTWPKLESSGGDQVLGGRGYPWRARTDGKEIQVHFHPRESTTVSYAVVEINVEYCIGVRKSSGRLETIELRMYRALQTGADHWWSKSHHMSQFSPFHTHQVLLVWTVWDGLRFSVPSTYVFLVEHT